MEGLPIWANLAIAAIIIPGGIWLWAALYGAYRQRPRR